MRVESPTDLFIPMGGSGRVNGDSEITSLVYRDGELGHSGVSFTL